VSGNKIDLKPIQNLYIENLIDAAEVLGKEKVSKIFEGSDVYLDTKTGELKTNVNGQVKVLKLQEEADALRFVKSADADGNGELTLEELTPVLAKTPGFEKFKPEDFMQYLDVMVTKRYAVIAKNMEKFASDLAFKPLLDTLDTYNVGLYWDDVRQATSVMPLNGLTKTGVNIVTFPRNIVRLITKGRGIPILPKDFIGDEWNLADGLAKKTAENEQKERSAAIQELRDKIAEGVKKGEDWAMKGNFDEAFKKLSAKSQDILSKRIPAKEINDILAIKDDSKRYDALKAFAEGERPGALGLGGGKAGGASGWNYFGWHRNTVFARSIAAFLGSKAATQDKAYTDKLHKDANLLRKDILGDGGGFTNMVSWGLTGLLHIVTSPIPGDKFTVDQTPRRRWGDEASMDGVGRSLDAGIMLFLSYKGIKSFGEAWKLRGVGELNDVRNVFRANGVFGTMWNEFKPFSNSLFAAEREGPVAARLAAAEEAGEAAKQPGWFGRQAARFKDTLFGKLPPMEEVLSPAQLKAYKAGGAVTSTAGTVMTYGAVMLYITQNVDKAFESKYNPYETDHELDMDPYPDPMKPDPLLYPAIKK